MKPIRREQAVRGALFALLTGSMILTLQNCDDVRLIPNKAEVHEASIVPPDPFGGLQPVLAVRNTGCITCHAQIDGDLVTDFGAGDPFFMGTDLPSNHPKQMDYYGPFASKHFMWTGVTWAGSSIKGDVYVPDIELKDSRLLAAYNNPSAANPPLARPLKLLDFVRGRFVDPTVNAGQPTVLIPTSTSADLKVPGLRGQFKSRKTVWIDSPTANEIRNLEQGKDAELVLAKPGVVIYKGSPGDVVTGFSAIQSQKTYHLYLVNDAVTKCKGDVIIDGVVFLNNLNLDTDSAGCRLYVTGSVFIQGPITYKNGGDSNLQITSARAIVMGMRTMKARFTQLGTPAMVSGLRQAFTDDEELGSNEAILNDRDHVDDLTNDAGPYRLMVDQTGTPIAIEDDFDTEVWLPAPGRTTFPDPKTCVPGIPTASQPCGIDWTGNYPAGLSMRKTVEYHHLLLNAPKIHSRYYGVFQGVIIGEDVLFAVNNFSFVKDPVMFRTKLLPLLENRIFNMSSD